MWIYESSSKVKEPGITKMAAWAVKALPHHVHHDEGVQRTLR